MLERVPAGPMDYTSDVILIRSKEVTTDDPRFEAAEDEVRSALLSTPGVVNVAQEPVVRRRNAVLIEFGLEDEEAAENVIDQVLEGVELGGIRALRDRRVDGRARLPEALARRPQEGELQFGLPPP